MKLKKWKLPQEEKCGVCVYMGGRQFGEIGCEVI